MAKKHTVVYIDYFYDGDSSCIVCENCFLNGFDTPADEIHHVGGRKSGGSKLIDIPSKLMAVCRLCHDKMELLPFLSQADLHIEFCKQNNYAIDENLCRSTLIEITNNFKNAKAK